MKRFASVQLNVLVGLVAPFSDGIVGSVRESGGAV